MRPHLKFILVILCIFILVSVVSAVPLVKTPISGDDNGLVGSRPGIQPALAPTFTGGSIPGASSGLLSPVRGPDTVSQRCSICGAGIDNQSESLSGQVHIAADEESQKIAKIQANITLEGGDWIAGHTSVSNLTPEAFNKLLGAVPPVGIQESAILPLPNISTQSLPASFTWQSNGGDYTTPIRNQGQCGSCWAFASTAVFESFWERLNQNPGLNPDFSEQYLVSCSNQGGCSGGWNVLSYFINQAGKSGGVGTVMETDYPYTASDTTCKNLAAYTRYKAPTGTSWSYVGNSYSVPSIDQMKTALYTYGPLWVAFGVDSAFSAYRSGIYSSSSNPGINHAVALVGWGTAGDGRTYWICKNSWGTWWGEGGWFRIYAGSNQIGYSAAYMTNPVLPAPIVSSISPSSAKAGSLVTITDLSGTNFVSGCRVNVTRSGYANVTVTNVQVPSSTQITGTMNLAGTVPGTWNIVVTNPDGKAGALNGGFTILPNITARFYGIPDTTVFPYTVRFYDASEGSPVSWAWTFGDGGTNTTRNPVHTYTRTGTFPVSLTVSDGYGSSSSSDGGSG